MCLLSYFPAGVMPDVELLRNGSVVNDDGHGYAIIIDGEIVVGRSMSFDEIVAEFADLRERHPDGDAMFHSRYSTCGAYNLGNVHPFHVNGSPLTLLAHNGHIHQASPDKGDDRVDTRVFAEDILMRKFPVLDSPKTQRRLHNFIGSYNKLVILTVDPRFARNAYIVNEKAGIWKDGVWYSNTGYLPSLASKWKDEEGWDTWQPKGYHLRWTQDQKGTWFSYRVYDEPRDHVEDYKRWWEDAEAAEADRVDAEALKKAIKALGTPAAGTYASGGREGYAATETAERLALTAESAHCEFCDSDRIDQQLNFCVECGTCQDCLETVSDCQCAVTGDAWTQLITCGICGSADCGCDQCHVDVPNICTCVNYVPETEGEVEQ